MSDIPRAHTVIRKGAAPDDDGIALDYEGRFMRRKRLTSEAGQAFVVDLAEVTSLDDGDALALTDGSRIAVRAAPEALLEITGDGLARLAWHIGNRHTPCRIEADRLLIRADHVLADMLERLGAQVRALEAPFQPEGGAYGHGRTLGHSHGDHHQGAARDTHAHPHDHGASAGSVSVSEEPPDPHSHRHEH